MARLAAAEVVQAAEQLEVLAPGEELVDGVVLHGQADPAPDLRGFPCDVEAGDLGAAAVRPQQGGEDPHRGGLAGAVGAEQPADGSGRHREVEPVERHGAAVALAEPFGEN